MKQTDDQRPSKEDEKWLQQIVTALGELPLALELVAAYAGIQHLSLTHVLLELKQDTVQATSLNLNTQHTLISRFDRSWAALTPTEQRLFSGLPLLSESDFPREGAVDLAFASMDASERRIGTQYNKEGKLIQLPDFEKNLRKLSEQYVARIVAYILIEPLPDERLRLHPLLRQYAAKRQGELSHEIYKVFVKTVESFWYRYGQLHPDYEGLSSTDAESVWEARQAADHELTASQVTRPIPSLSRHAAELLHLGQHMVTTRGERERIRIRFEEGLRYSEAARDNIAAGKFHQQLAVLDEQEGNYTGAVKHYSQALYLFEQVGSPYIHVVRKALIRLKKNTNEASAGLTQDISGFVRIEQGTGVEEHVYEVHDKPLQVGRSLDVDIHLEDSSVSRIHATIIPLGGGHYGLRDEGSTNGTWLTGQLVAHKIYPLHSGDIFSVGRITMIFSTSE